MFRRSRKAEGDGERREPFTYVHRGTTVVGELDAEGRVRVHGTVRGNVRVRGVLEVAEAGVVEGERIDADEVKILGRVVAAVHALGKVEIWKGGELVGDVRAASLDIEEGARFTGRSEMTGADEGDDSSRPAPQARPRAGADGGAGRSGASIGSAVEGDHGAGVGTAAGKDVEAVSPERVPDADRKNSAAHGTSVDRPA